MAWLLGCSVYSIVALLVLRLTVAPGNARQFAELVGGDDGTGFAVHTFDRDR